MDDFILSSKVLSLDEPPELVTNGAGKNFVVIVFVVRNEVDFRRKLRRVLLMMGANLHEPENILRNIFYEILIKFTMFIVSSKICLSLVGER